MPFFYKPKANNGVYIKLPQVFDKVLKGNGCWPTESDVNDFWFQLKNILYDLYGWIMFINMSFIVFCELAYLVVNAMDVLKAVESFCSSIIGLFLVIRTLHFRLVLKDLKQLFIVFARDVWINVDKYPRIVQHCHRNMRPVLVYFVLMFNVLILYSVIPIFVFYNTNQTMDSTDKRMPYSMIFPYDAQNGLAYFVTYICAIHAGYMTISHFYALDALLLFFVSYLCGQFKILHGDIVRLIPECHAEWQKLYGVSRGVSISGFDVSASVGSGVQPDAGRIKLLQDMYTKRLHELSARHNDLMSFCIKLNGFVSFPLLLNVVTSTFLICFCGFQFLISGTTSFSDFMLFFSFFLSVTLQLYVICSCGTMLIKYSTDTAFYLYLSNWEGGQLSKDSPLVVKPEDMDAASLNVNLPSWRYIKYHPAGKDFRNKLRFMIMRSHRPVQLNAMEFTILSLECFTKILSSSMSYFALLKTFLDKQK